MKPFTINIPDSVLTDLARRIEHTRWPDEVGDSWRYGTDNNYLQSLCQYWITDFNWRAKEDHINSYPQYTTEIDGVTIHYLYQKSSYDNAIPLMLVHGWPGSFWEFGGIIDALTDPVSHGGECTDAFHVICPSLPGFGFSDRPSEEGFDIKRAADVLQQLMRVLGYSTYGVQGGDWGSCVASWLGSLDRERVCGIHLNMAAVPSPSGKDGHSGLSSADKEFLNFRKRFARMQAGYREIQSTKPQTLGYALNDSPAGLAAWIVEKFHAWTDCDGHIENSMARDDLLINLTIYWVTQTITSSFRMYYETRKSGNFIPTKVLVPTGCAIFPREFLNAPRPWVEDVYNVTRWTEMSSGGHFAALENPQALVEDIRAFFRTVR